MLVFFNKFAPMRCLFIALFYISACGLNAQTDSNMIQFSGIIVTSDSLHSLPFVAVKNSKRKIVALSDYEGFFSFAAKKGDTVTFSMLGYSTAKYVIPTDLVENRYSIVQLMTNDTFYLAGQIVRAYPKSQEVFYNLEHGEFADDRLETARKNLSKENNDALSFNLAMDGNENYKNYMNQQYQRYYWIGQTPPTRILDPLAWNEFFKYWKSGKFKKK